MEKALVVLVAVVLLGLLLECTRREWIWRGLAAKTLLSGTFILAAVLVGGGKSQYESWLLVGLGLCLVGDVLLGIPGRKTFLAGLVAFLLGHVAYVIAFVSVGGLGMPLYLGGAVSLVASTLVFLWLSPKLGKMKGPVTAYVVVITAMVWGALGVMSQDSLPLVGRSLVLLGAVLFYISDVFVAINRFVEKRFRNRLIGLPLYYTAQFLLAFTLLWLG